MKSFRINVPQADLDDLRDRLARTRWAGQLPGDEWQKGAPQQYLRELADHWQNGFDWRKAEAELNDYPQFTTEIDGQTIHFLHVRSSRDGAFPLILTHGWPGSVVEFLDLIAPLTEPADGGPAFHLVIPSIPGFGFSGPTTEPGWDSRRIAGAFAELMARLGYQRYGAQGGDFGALIAPDLGRVDAEHVVGVHVNAATVGFIPFGEIDEHTLSAGERVRVERMRNYLSDGNAYFQMQATRPQTIGYALTDSPVGQLAWIVEKFHEWAHEPIDRDRLLTNVMIYWLTATAGSSANLYYEQMHSGNWPVPSDVPTAVAVFATDIAIRDAAAINNSIVRWTEFDRGGHFAALEAPDLLGGDIRAFFQQIRPA